MHRFAAEHDDPQAASKAVHGAARLTAGTAAEALTAVREVHQGVSSAGPRTRQPGGDRHDQPRPHRDRTARPAHRPPTLAGTDGVPMPEQLGDPRARLYGLHTVLRPRFAQEEENHYSLASCIGTVLPTGWHFTTAMQKPRPEKQNHRRSCGRRSTSYAMAERSEESRPA